MKKISIGVPCYNEEKNIELMYEALIEQMSCLPQYDFEIIFADNCSTDDSENIMRMLAQKDKRVKVILNQSNVGPYRSGINVYKNASGDAYIGIPCDFQEPPEMIPVFIKEWEKGNLIVWGQKTASKESWIKYKCRDLYYSIMKIFADYPQIRQTDSFGIMDRTVIDFLVEFQAQDSMYSPRQLFPEYGFSIKLIPYTQNKRERGKSSYNLVSYFHFAITTLCNSSTKLLHLITGIGFLVSFICIIVAFVYFIYKCVNWYAFDLGMAPLIIGLFLISGIQLMSIGIIGEYLIIVLRRITKKPLVVEKEKINF